MNIFGIGGAELVLILVIMLVVAGPKRMIQWAYVLGKYVAVLQKMWSQAAAALQKEFDEAGVELEVPKELPTKGDLQRSIATAIQKNVPLNEVTDELGKDIASVKKATQFTTAPAIAAKSPPVKHRTPPTNGSNASVPDAETSAKPEEPKFGTWSGTDAGQGNEQS
jgi:Sec-independent protein translocase protein TatA